MTKKINNINCPHCNEEINISMLANKEFTKNLEVIVEEESKGFF